MKSVGMAPNRIRVCRIRFGTHFSDRFRKLSERPITMFRTDSYRPTDRVSDQAITMSDSDSLSESVCLTQIGCQNLTLGVCSRAPFTRNLPIVSVGYPRDPSFRPCTVWQAPRGAHHRVHDFPHTTLSSMGAFVFGRNTGSH